MVDELIEQLGSLQKEVKRLEGLVEMRDREIQRLNIEREVMGEQRDLALGLNVSLMARIERIEATTVLLCERAVESIVHDPSERPPFQRFIADWQREHRG